MEGDRDRRSPEAGVPLGSYRGVRRARPGRRHRPLDDALTRDRRCDRRREPSRRWVSRTSRSTPPPRCARPRSGTRATRLDPGADGASRGSGRARGDARVPRCTELRVRLRRWVERRRRARCGSRPARRRSRRRRDDEVDGRRRRRRALRHGVPRRAAARGCRADRADQRGRRTGRLRGRSLRRRRVHRRDRRRGRRSRPDGHVPRAEGGTRRRARALPRAASSSRTSAWARRPRFAASLAAVLDAVPRRRAATRNTAGSVLVVGGSPARRAPRV